MTLISHVDELERHCLPKKRSTNSSCAARTATSWQCQLYCMVCWRQITDQTALSSGLRLLEGLPAEWSQAFHPMALVLLKLSAMESWPPSCTSRRDSGFIPIEGRHGQATRHDMTREPSRSFQAGTWEFAKAEALTQTPDSRALVTRPPTKMTPNVMETATYQIGSFS